MEGGTVQPEDISPPGEYAYNGEGHSAPSRGKGNKRARAAEASDEEDEEDVFDPALDQDSTYVDPSLAAGGSGSSAPAPRPGQSRQRSVSNMSNGEARERKPIQIEYIQDKSRRHITFSKRKAGIMKKAYELSTLTGTQILLLVVSETGLVYTFTTPKLSAIVNEDHGQKLIEACLAAEEGETPAFAQRDFGGGEPRLTIKRSNGDRSPHRRRQASNQNRPPTPSNEGRRTSGRHPQPMPPPSQQQEQQQVPQDAPPAPGPSPRRMPSNPHMAPMPAMPQPMHHPQQLSQGGQPGEPFSGLYDPMTATSNAQSHSLHAPMSIPPYYTDGGYATHPQDPHAWSQQ